MNTRRKILKRYITDTDAIPAELIPLVQPLDVWVKYEEKIGLCSVI